ncbi:MAG TPA: hypothetical protein VNX18_04955 [Bryobacteraceae bacterium]|nr:hypothetical protein [Bryobacteraceae bacterium]
MEQTIEDRITRAETLAKSDDVAGALVLAEGLVAQYPEDPQVWSLLAYLHARNGEYAAAVSDVSSAIAVNHLEPCLFFARGRYELNLGDWLAAERDFTKGLDLCDSYKDDYYRETLHFLRAEARLHLGRRSDALLDLSRVDNSFTFWTYRLVTKAALLAECVDQT